MFPRLLYANLLSFFLIHCPCSLRYEKKIVVEKKIFKCPVGTDMVRLGLGTLNIHLGDMGMGPWKYFHCAALDWTLKDPVK